VDLVAGRPWLSFVFHYECASAVVHGIGQGWAKLVSNLTFSKRKAMVFFQKTNAFKTYSVEFQQKLTFLKRITLVFS